MSESETPTTAFSVLQLLTANVAPAEEWYEGTEYKYGRLVFRPAQFRVEGYLLIALSVYVGLYLLGKQINYNKASAWLNAHRNILAQEFSKPTLASGELVSDGGSDFYNFSTGRRGVKSLHTVFTFQPRHDVFMRIFNFFWSLADLQYRPYDKIELDFTLAPDAAVPNFVFAVADKDEIKDFTQGRYDLTFAKTNDLPGLPQYTVFTEAADVSDQFLKPSNPAVNLSTLLSDPTKARFFRSLAVTDLPFEAPETTDVQLTEQPRHLILTLEAPPTADASQTAELVRLVFAIVDNLTSPKFQLRPETKNKLRKSRTDMEAFIAKQVKKEDSDAAEKKRAEKKKAEEERVAKLSAAEQKKHEEKERKKNLRKAQMKGATRSRMG